MSAAMVQPELLHRAAILKKLDPGVRDKLMGLNIEATVDSTNSALQRIPPAQQHAMVILAEQQTKGRGRHGRQWHSPFGQNLYLSLGWRFDKHLSGLGCLPLVLALAAAKALSRAGLQGHRVKWPNDLLLDGRKLCGCLVEMQAEPKGPCHAVLGVGINVHMPASGETAGIDQPWTDLYSQLPGFSRNELAALLLEELVVQLVLFDDQGFEPFKAVWEAWDGLYGQIIGANPGTGPVRGVASGIDDMGALLLDTGTEILKLHSGEVSLHKTKL